MSADKLDRELGWNDEIENDSSDFILLPEGDYNFEIIDFERGRHSGSEKLPPCNKAVLTIRIKGEIGSSTIKHNFFLHSKTEGMLCSFFSSIGARKVGERISMDWDSVIFASGRAKVGIRKWVKDNGEEMMSNEIKKFYPAEEPQKTFTAGNF